MHLVIILPSAEHASTAGVRIRYERLADVLAAQGARFSIIAYADLDQLEVPPTAVIFCKVYTFGAIATMARLVSEGVLVGCDIFDDYFSQTERPNLARYRRWLALAVSHLDVAIVSTPIVADLVHKISAIPVFVMPDTLEPTDISALRAALDEKLAAARASGVIDVVWFGIGHNPHFHVGLDDLISTGERLAELERSGWSVRLRIVTSLSSLTGGRAAMLARLPVPWTIESWTLESEAAALDEALIAYLPVSGHAFGRAKTLNRAVTAARRGCQLLSIGYPLYEALEPFVYRSPARLVDDLSTETLAIRSDTVGAALQRLSDVGDRITVTRALVATLTRLGRERREATTTVAIQGLSSETIVDKATIVMRAPFSRTKVVSDIQPRYNALKGHYDLWVSRRILDKLIERTPELAVTAVGKGSAYRLPSEFSIVDAELPEVMSASGLDRSAYLKIIEFCRRAVERLLPTATMVILERDSLANHLLEQAHV